MSIVNVVRLSTGTEKHKATLKNTDENVLHFALDGDNIDFANAATGNVFDAKGAGPSFGTFISCKDFQEVVFKIEYSTTGGPRQFRVAFEDFNATPATIILPEIWTPADTGVTDRDLGGAAYRIAESIIVPCVGFNKATLYLVDALTAPLVKAWVSAR